MVSLDLVRSTTIL